MKQDSRVGTCAFLCRSPEEFGELVSVLPQTFGDVQPLGLDLYVCTQRGKVLTKTSVSKDKGLSLGMCVVP